MSLTVVERKIPDAGFQDTQILPKDFEKVIGKAHVFVIDFFANIKAFFKILFLGPWKNFSKNIDLAELEIANRNKLELYRNMKNKNLKNHEKAFMELTGYEVYTQNQVNHLKGLHKDFKVFQVFRTIVSEKDYNRVEALLKEIEKENNPNYYAVLISLQDLAKDKKVCDEIRNLINEKLKEISKSPQKNVKYLPEKPELATYSIWKKVALGVLTLAGIAAVGAVGYGTYAYFGKTPILPSSSNQAQVTGQSSVTKINSFNWWEQLSNSTCNLEDNPTKQTSQMQPDTSNKIYACVDSLLPSRNRTTTSSSIAVDGTKFKEQVWSNETLPKDKPSSSFSQNLTDSDGFFGSIIRGVTNAGNWLLEANSKADEHAQKAQELVLKKISDFYLNKGD